MDNKMGIIKATVVMVTYNCVEQVENAMRSIISQDYDNIELIIIDGESTDGTLDILHNYDNNISVLISEPDSGIYEAMNKGVRLATGDIIGFLGSDDVYLPGAISAIVQGFRESGADLVYGNVIFHKVDGDKYFDYGKLDFSNYVYDNLLCHQSFFVRTALQKIMPFDLSYRLAADYKFHMTLYFSGCRFHHVPKDIAVYNCMGNSGSHPYWTVREFRHAVEEMIMRFPQVEKMENDIRISQQNYDYWLLERYLFRKFRRLGSKLFVAPQRELILFGTGMVGQECFDVLSNNIHFGQVVCFWDNDNHKQGKEIEGVPIRKPMTGYSGKLVIVTTNLYDGEVCQQLEEAGLIRGRDYWGWSDFVKNLFVLYWQGVLGRTGSNRIIQRELTHVKGEGKIIRFDICSEECSKV